MTIRPLSASLPPAPASADRPSNPEEAARQFEAILVQQFVATMTDGLFEQTLAGEGAPGWMDSQNDTQRDTLTQILADHLTENGNLGIADRLMRQWRQAGQLPDDAGEAPPAPVSPLRRDI